MALRIGGPVNWTQDTDLEIIHLGPANDAAGGMRRIFGGSGDRLVLMHPNRQPTFDRLKGFLDRGARTLDTTGGSNLVVLLTPETDVASLEIHAAARFETTGTLANVVGTIPGRRADEIVVFSGHYDHIGIVEPVEGDSIANGANDDASGTTAVIELARYFKALGRPERTLMFVAFTAEESGGYGSRYLADHVNPDHIVALFNVEMIGKPAAEGPNRAWITGWDESDFGTILAGAVPDSVFTFYGDPYPDQNLFYRSDNATFARLGVPAHSISTTPIDVDPDYHHVTDEIETLDIDHVTATIRGIAIAATPIIAGEATPTRVDPERLQ
jgi:Zn-dependent M28 family amino/carboxypeptidase